RVGEDERHLREAELRDRSQLREPLETGERLLDGEGQLPLDFRGRQGRSDCVDLDLNRGRVGEGVEGEAAEGQGASPREQEREREHESTVRKAPTYEPGE